MKRTPLKRKAPMKKPRSDLSRSTPIDHTRKERRRRDRSDAEHSIPWNDVRNLIFVRAGGRCELCDAPLVIGTMQGHHRRTRQIGPDCACNALALCGDCHHGEVHGQPVRARELGQIVSRHSVDRPSTLPVTIRRGEVFLSCHGTYEREAV
jgi:hypothetical protein